MTRLVLLAAVATLWAAGCASQPFDRTRVRGGNATRALDAVPVRGFQSHVSYRRDRATRKIGGELIAVDPSHVWVMRRARLYAIDRRLVTEMTIEAFSGHGGLGAVWTALGTLSALSHGYWALISGNVWLAAGIPSAVWESKVGDVDVPLGVELSGACQFARFPMGLPRAWLARAVPIGARVRSHPLTSCGARATTPTPARRPSSRPAARPTTQPASAPTTRPATPDEPGVDDDPKLAPAPR